MAADHDGVVGVVGSSSAEGYHVVYGELLLGVAVGASAGVVVFLEPFPYAAAPLHFSGLEAFESVHGEGVVVFPEAGGVGDEFGVLPVDEVSEGLHGVGWHVLGFIG